jgi:hypothetical protein
MAAGDVTDLAIRIIPPEVVERLPESLARENLVMPLAYDGETITLAAVRATDIALADRLRAILAKNVRLIPAPRHAILQAINRNYGQTAAESVESMLGEFTDRGEYKTLSAATGPPPAPALPRSAGAWAQAMPRGAAFRGRPSRAPGRDSTSPLGREGMFFYVVEEGQRVLMRRADGTMRIITGPKRVWRGRNTFQQMEHYVAHPGSFLIVRYRDGRQQHLPGPAELWLDPREHLAITTEDALQISAKEAVVVYSKDEAANAISRRLVFGPALFVPQPGEWLHTFSWHSSRGGSQGAPKVANSLVFQKLWLLPDQMYHDVPDVRTADDAVLTIRLMLFFELTDIERMLDTTHDPIGDFINAATSDVVDFTGKHDFEQFKRNTHRLNELETYQQLTGRAGQCGYRINKVVFRGYGAAAALQQMHDQAIQARTRLQLDRATEQQAQDLEDYKLGSQLARAGKRRTEQTAEVEQELELARRRQEADLRRQEAQHAFLREKARLEAELHAAIRQRQESQQREHLAALREMGVDLTAYLTQARADRVIELRGAAATHVHLDRVTEDAAPGGETRPAG